MINPPLSHWPVPVTGLSPVSAGTIVWRREGRMMLTVVVKATIRLVAGGTAELIEPEPVLSVETRGAGEVSYARDDAPALERADVTAWGMSATAASGDVALVVGLGHERLLVKQTRASGPTIRCFAPLLMSDRLHQQQGAGRPKSPLQVIEINNNFDWSWLQNAPPDQQLASLRGDEWIATRGLHPDHQDLSTRLPSHYAMARLYGGDALPRVPLPLRLDSVHLVTHQLRGSLVWRAHWPLLTDEIPHDLQVAAGIAPFGQILELGDLPPSDVIEEPTDEFSSDPWAEMRRTRAVTDEDLASMATALPTFMAGDPQQGNEPTFIFNAEAMEAFRQTRSLTRETQADLEKAFREAAPFALADKPVEPHHVGIPGAPWSATPTAAPRRPAFSDSKDTISELRPMDQAALAAGAQMASDQQASRSTSHWFPAVDSVTTTGAAQQGTSLPTPRPPPPPRRNSAARAAAANPDLQAAAPTATATTATSSEQDPAAMAAQQRAASEQARAEIQERQRRMDELKAEEEARVAAAREAEERRVEQAKRFEEEQRLAREREAERQQKEQTERREKARHLRSSLYSGMKRRS